MKEAQEATDLKEKLAREIARWRAGRVGPARRPVVEYRRRKRQAQEAVHLDFRGGA